MVTTTTATIDGTDGTGGIIVTITSGIDALMLCSPMIIARAFRTEEGSYDDAPSF
jgi:hypothetical protein